MAANGISTLGNKQARQLAKLALAAQDRAAANNNRSSYDITQLPTRYSGNELVDNPNTGGLVEGRYRTSVRLRCCANTRRDITKL